ncbi:hypothetical protein [Nocardia sp. NPDC050793]|uniref:hypothetical protein n=1 Tax=Nocardia sp. NPDC050793 TaxID=3155159 RepID=UPI0033DABB28
MEIHDETEYFDGNKNVLEIYLGRPALASSGLLDTIIAAERTIQSLVNQTGRMSAVEPPVAQRVTFSKLLLEVLKYPVGSGAQYDAYNEVIDGSFEAYNLSSLSDVNIAGIMHIFDVERQLRCANIRDLAMELRLNLENNVGCENFGGEYPYLVMIGETLRSVYHQFVDLLHRQQQVHAMINSNTAGPKEGNSGLASGA